MKLFGCVSCRTTFNDWNKHIKTKRHITLMKASIYASIVFNSHLVSKTQFIFPLMPKILWPHINGENGKIQTRV